MRVIAGSAKSLRLVTLDSLDTRPTTDRIKETLFNMISPDIPCCRFLDLFSGSGGIGIEALSRGAEYACLVEQNKKAVACIEKNLTFTHLHERARVITGDAVLAIDTLERKTEVFDIIFMDPPYGQLFEQRVLSRLSRSAILTERTIIIVESDLKTDFGYIDQLGFQIEKIKKYKTNKHTFLYRRT